MTDTDAGFDGIARLDKLVHEPARLALLTALSGCAEADFTFLQRLVGLTQGNLGSHLARLEDAGLVEISRGFAGRQPRTRVRLTDGGREALDAHWASLERLRRLGGAVPEAD